MRLIIVFLMLVMTVQAQLLQVRNAWNGLPVAAAQIIVHNDTLLTDARGLVRLQVELPVQISIKAAGYFSQSTQITNQKAQLIYLMPIQQTDYITVTGSRLPDVPLEIPSHRSIVTEKELQAVYGSVARALAAQSGTFVKDYGTQGSLQTLSVRGMSAEQTQVLVDGVPLNNLQLGSVDFSLFEISDVQTLEIYRGSNALLGGSGAIGGSVHLFTPEPQDHLSVYSRWQYFSLNNKSATLQLQLPFGAKFRSVFHFGHANGLNRYTVPINGKTISLKNRDFRENYLSYKLRYQPALHWNATFYISHFKKSGGAPKPFTTAESEQANLSRLTNDNTFVRASVRYQSLKTQFSLNLFARNEWMTYRDPALIINGASLHSLHFNKERGLQGRFHYSPRQALLIKSGVEIIEQSISSSNAGHHQRLHTAAYALADWQPNFCRLSLQAFHFNGGVRLERYSNLSWMFLPSIGISAQWKQNALFASIGKNYRVPGFNDLYWQPGGNPQLKSEKSLNVEGGWRYQKTWKKWLMQSEVTLFRNTVNDQIKWLPGSGGVWQPVNIRAVKSEGLELDFELGSIDNLHRLRFSYTRSRSVKNKAEYPGDPNVGNQLPFLPREQLNATLQTGYRRLRAGMQVSYAGFRFTDLSNDPLNILPAYWQSDCWISGKFDWGGLELRPELRINNLFDQRFSILSGYPLPGRTFAITLYANFTTSNLKGGTQ